jgi:tRNA 2-thiouridine synthesizing protein A
MTDRESKPHAAESNSADADIQHRLDASGLLCPEPVMLLHNKVRDMAPGEVLEVLATDPSTERDVPKFCQFLGHNLVLHEQTESGFRYLIRKKEA